MSISEIHYIKCPECGETLPYEFSKEKVKNYGKPSFENMQHGEIRSGIIPLVYCKNCENEMQVPDFRPHNRL